jgi:hypothetical protein
MYLLDDLPIYIYDTETFPNMVLFMFRAGDDSRTFEISDRSDDREALFEFLEGVKGYPKLTCLASFNGHGFDDHVLNYVLVNRRDTVEDIYDFAMSKINGPREFPSTPFSNFTHNLRQIISIDLMRLLKAERGGLKALGAKLDMPRLQESPIPWGTLLRPPEMDQIIAYCHNDLDVTEKLLSTLSSDIKIRMEYWELLQENAADLPLLARLLSASDSKLCEILLEKRLFVDGTKPKKPWLKKEKKWSSTGELLLSPSVKFNSLPFKAMLDEIRQWDVTYRSELRDDEKIKLHSPSNTDMFTFEGVSYKIAGGGLHSEDRAGKFEADADTTLVLVDVTSFYPNIIINDKVCPAHLTQTNFLSEYEGMTIDRQNYQKEGNDLRAQALKIAINSVYGKSNSVYSWLFDPMMMGKVTLNGQLYLLMMVERATSVHEVKVISANTDGILFRVPREEMGEFQSVIDRYCQDLNFKVKFKEYDRWYRRDVNNYVARSAKTGEIESKGAFAAAGKDHGRIIRKAAISYLMDGIPLEETILASQNPHDFMFYFAADRGFEIRIGAEKQQKVNRWINVKEGVQLRKYKISEADLKGAKIPDCETILLANDMPEVLPPNIDYDWYIARATALVESLTPSDKPKGTRIRKTKHSKHLTEDDKNQRLRLLTDENVDRDKVKAAYDIENLKSEYEMAINPFDHMHALLVSIWISSAGNLNI